MIEVAIELNKQNIFNLNVDYLFSVTTLCNMDYVRDMWMMSGSWEKHGKIHLGKTTIKHVDVIVFIQKDTSCKT